MSILFFSALLVNNAFEPMISLFVDEERQDMKRGHLDLFLFIGGAASNDCFNILFIASSLSCWWEQIGLLWLEKGGKGIPKKL